MESTQSDINPSNSRISDGIYPLFREPKEALTAVLRLPHAPDRTLAEAFIQATFSKAFNAKVSQFNPWLLSVEPPNAMWGAAGIRAAEQQSLLFSEQYLDSPAEEALGKRLGHAVNRDAIAEVGNLATPGGGKSRYLILAIAVLLKTNGFRWALCTAVSPLYQVFLRMGLQPVPLAVADPSRLGENAHAWGSYYNLRPQVCGLDVNRTYSLFEQVMNPKQPHLFGLWQQCHQVSSACNGPHQAFA